MSLNKKTRHPTFKSWIKNSLKTNDTNDIFLNDISGCIEDAVILLEFYLTLISCLAQKLIEGGNAYARNIEVPRVCTEIINKQLIDTSRIEFFL